MCKKRKVLISTLLFASATSALALPVLPTNVPVVPLTDITPGKSTYRSVADIEQWKAADNRSAMKEHGWRLFAGLMRPVYSENGETIRVYDTWHTLDEAVPPLNQKFIQFQNTQATSASKRSGIPQLTRSRAILRSLAPPSQQSPHDATRFTSALALPAEATQNDRALAESIVSDVKYSTEISKWIVDTLIEPDTSGKLVKQYKLKSILAGGATALPFNETRGTMIKPAYTIVKGKGATIIGRWKENIGVVNPVSINTILSPANANTRVAGERTWTQEAVIVAPGVSLTQTFYGRNGKKLPVVSVNDFHYFKISKAMADALKTGILSELMGPNISDIKEGDYALLTSMHIATREVDDWTWQTFWWQPKDKQTSADLGIPPDLKSRFLQKDWKPLSYFKIGVGYDYLTPASRATHANEAIISSNPYLEGAFGLPDDLKAVYGAKGKIDGVNIFIRDAQDKAIAPYVHEGNGLKTNCMTCHKAAAYPADKLGNLPTTTQGRYPDYGKLTGTEDLFFGRLQTHFMWGVANKVTDRESTP
ncbi:MAG: hypothetical protein HOP04_02655 [Methylophilaceae bacterium]|nr:hypothetical protein [Methylophilaceae bacterium]